MNAGFTDDQVKRLRQTMKDEIDKKRREELRKVVKEDINTELKHFVAGEGTLSGLREDLMKHFLREEAKKLGG